MKKRFTDTEEMSVSRWQAAFCSGYLHCYRQFRNEGENGLIVFTQYASAHGAFFSL